MEFDEIIKDIKNNKTVLQMKNFRQHYDTSCYEHCMNVAKYTYLICKKHNLDYISATRAAMLHDLFLYDWRVKSSKSPRFHGYKHPKIALENSKKLFDLNERERDIILNHMWPLTLSLPKYKESFIVTLADKYSTFIETKEYYKHNYKLQKIYRYAYVFLCLLVFRIV